MKANDITDSTPRQEENKFSGISHSRLIERYIKHFDEYPQSRLDLLNFYISFYNCGKSIYASNVYIASILGVHPRTVQKAKQQLIDDGFITSEQKQCYATCDIWVSPFFSTAKVRASLSYFLSALKWIPIAALLSTPKVVCAAPIKTVTRNKGTLLYRNDIYKENYIPSYVTNVQKKDCSMSGILARVCDKLSQDTHTPPPQPSPAKHRAMLEPEVLKITEIPLTKWGQIRMCAFPAHIITHARLSYDKSLKGQAAFISLFQAALLICREKNIEPDWKRVQYLTTFFKQPDNAPMVLNSSPLGIPVADNLETTAEDVTYVRRDETPTSRTPKREYTKQDPNANSHKREAYKPWKESPENKRAAELIYMSYFTVEDGYKKSGNPLRFPNPYKERYEQYLNDALQNTQVNRETMEAELYDMYLKQKGITKNGKR